MIKMAALSGGCLKTLRSPFDKLRANGVGREIVEDFPFVLSLSKHEFDFLSSLPRAGCLSLQLPP
jgi:hypothetical protein